MSEVTVEQAVDKAQSQAVETDEILAALMGKIVDVNSQRPNLKVLVFSDPDGGKSTFGASASNNLIVDAEDGLMSIQNMPETQGKNVKRYPYKSFQGFETVVNYLAESNPAFDWVETLTIDTLSELHKKGLAEITEREWRKRPNSANRYVAETEHHTENNEHIRRIVSQLKDLDRNLIILAHSRIIEPKDQPAKIFPDFSEKLAKSIVALVDICVYIEKKNIDGEVKRVFRFHTPENIMTKCRIGTLPAEAVDVTWDKLWDAYQRHLAAGNK